MDVRVGIVVGSASDLPYAEEALAVLSQLDIGAELRVLSAHRTPAALEDYIRAAEAGGIRVLIGMAGHAAALPGVMAARTLLPVVGVPLPTSDLVGQDALLAIVQMPPGVPVRLSAKAIATRLYACGISDRRIVTEPLSKLCQ